MHPLGGTAAEICPACVVRASPCPPDRAPGGPPGYTHSLSRARGAGLSEALSPAGRAIVEEEEALLRRVRQALDRVEPARPPSQAAARELVSLRDQAVSASERDLPALLQGLTIAQALAGRERQQVLPQRDAPYFAHLALQHPDGPRDYLLGRATWVDLEAGVRIVDWRLSPIAAVFYQHEEGADIEEELPGGKLLARVLARRILVIEGGVLTGIIAGRRSLSRHGGRWTEEGTGALHGGGAGSAARPGVLGTGAGARGGRARPEVTALLDPQQYAAVSADPREHLLVTGSAGSGKTTVALHRLARIAAARGQPGRVAVVVPEEGLARLSRRLLEPLGLSAVRVETLDAWLRRSAAAVFGHKAVRLAPETPALVQSLKRHPSLAAPLLARIGPQRGKRLRPLRAHLADAFTDSAFLAGVVEAAAGTLPGTAVEETVRHTLRQIATPLGKEHRGIDPERLVTLDGRPIEEGTPDELAGTLDVEDLALLLWLRAQGGDRPGDGLLHLVVDEAEDVSVFELFLLGRLLARDGSLTLAGDEAQRTLQGAGGWEAALEAAGAAGAEECRLALSYRCPQPVADLAHRILGEQGPAEAPRSARAGAPVGLHHFPAVPQAHLFLAGALRDLLEREPGASVGVVAADASAAHAFHASLSALPETRLVLDGRFSFAPGIDVTDVAGAKGLEFDYVVVPDATAAAYPATDEARRRLHVAATRAAHQLWLLSAGRRSPLLPALDAGADEAAERLPSSARQG
ncbi:MAG: ATP-binding domain-containing protein [Deltaproteobacteria bacterium]|nr:ATP-binding domain-containing protein [Deltaproteobacteria bacterium]